ncbi:Uncharacterised protein [Raoultella terrigena]|uniref:Uncharacterized protein n=1 Tax=Raoultella terrigena TaxID=577 RepID=A0A3P8JKW0_RAOTE|nr:Uncharacterised protein [Raoultella terrigena]
MLPLSISFAKKDRFIYKKIQWKMSQNDKQAGRNGDQRLFARSAGIAHPPRPQQRPGSRYARPTCRFSFSPANDAKNPVQRVSCRSVKQPIASYLHLIPSPILRDAERSVKKRHPAGPWLPAEIGEPEAGRQGLAARDGGKRRIETGASPGTGEQVELSRPQAAGREVSAVRSTDFRAGPRGLLRGRRLSSP